MKQSPPSSSDWILRVVLVILGLFFVIFGLFEFTHGYFWHVSFSERFGRVAFTPALGLTAFGAIILMIGILPWQRISNWLERRDSNRRKSRHIR